MSDLSKVESRSQLLADIDTETIRADKINQATSSLWYESEQFNLNDVWHVASAPRQKVFAYRDKAFGAGGRKLPAGFHGAHGQFNRLQWTLDGKERLVDHLGRTESEAEEESGIDANEEVVQPPLDEEEEEVIQHPGIKPMWLLRFFTKWAKWGSWAADSSNSESEQAPLAPPPTEDAPTEKSDAPTRSAPEVIVSSVL